VTKLGRREILRGLALATTAVAAQASGFIPEAGLLRANAATMSVKGANGRRLRGRVMSSSELGRSVEASRSRPDGRALWSYASRLGLAARPEQATAIDANWEDGDHAGSLTMVPLANDNSSDRAMLVYRANSKSDLMGLALSRGDGWVIVYSAQNGDVQEESRFRQQRDRTILMRTPDGNERLLPAPPASSAAAGGRVGLAAPLAGDPYVQICSTICNWYLGIVCATFFGLTGLFVCAWVTVGSLGTGALACALVFVFTTYVVCSTVPEWACSQVCV
jgi:hypothetical protein